MVIAATSYPFLNILWTTLIFFAWVLFIWIAVTVLIDVFRRRDISGWAKAAWVVFVVILPWIGVLVYLIANHDGMAQRRMKEAQASQAQFDATCARPPAPAAPRARSRRPSSFSTVARSARLSSTPSRPEAGVHAMGRHIYEIMGPHWAASEGPIATAMKRSRRLSSRIRFSVTSAVVA